MSELSLTQDVLSEMAANGLDGYGTHLLADVQTGIPGLVLSEVDYNPRRDSPTAIVMSSVREMVTGQPQVRQYAPQQLLSANVIIHERGSTDSYGISEAKRHMAAELRQAITESMPGLTDEVTTYAVGEKAGLYHDLDIEAWTTDGDPLTDAKTISELCRDGLAFVIGDFLQLPLERVSGASYPATVAVKTNHRIEMALPANVGTLPTIGGGEVNTNKPKELQRVNEALASLHAETIARLGRLGIAVAHIVLAPHFTAGYETTAADRAISRAISRIQPL